MAAPSKNYFLAVIFVLNLHHAVYCDDPTTLESAESSNGPSLMAEVPSLPVESTSEQDEAIALSSVSPALTLEAPSLSVHAPQVHSFAPGLYHRLNLAHTECRAATFMEVVTGITGDNRSTPQNQLTSELPHVTIGDKPKKITCVPRNVTANESVVHIVNSTGLLQHLGSKNETEGRCAVVLFYAPWCMFCAKVAPHFNALARAFPQLDVLAIDAVHFSNLNSRFGTISVPNILVFHNSKAVARFNNTVRTLDTISTFVANVTSLTAIDSVNVTSEDYIGPLPSEPIQDTDYLLWLSWIFMIIFTGTVFVRSSIGQRVIQAVWNFGQEHHHHID